MHDFERYRALLWAPQAPSGTGRQQHSLAPGQSFPARERVHTVGKVDRKGSPAWPATSGTLNRDSAWPTGQLPGGRPPLARRTPGDRSYHAILQLWDVNESHTITNQFARFDPEMDHEPDHYGPFKLEPRSELRPALDRYRSKYSSLRARRSDEEARTVAHRALQQQRAQDARQMQGAMASHLKSLASLDTQECSELQELRTVGVGNARQRIHRMNEEEMQQSSNSRAVSARARLQPPGARGRARTTQPETSWVSGLRAQTRAFPTGRARSSGQRVAVSI
jgi:hypothetical protein